MNNGLLKIATIENLYREEDTPRITSYHEHHDGHTYTPIRATRERATDTPFYIGIELETECNHENTRAERLLITHSIPCVMEHDSSLNSRGGVEIISKPMSFKKWLSLETNVKNMCSELSLAGYMSHDTSTAGLHIHITRPTDDRIIDRILFIMETYKDELIKFARRSNNHYAQWYSEIGYTSDQLKSLDFVKNHKNTSNRYMALNLTNRNTIEFRFFKGTLNGTTLMASIELINNLVLLCSDLKRPVNRITWRLLTEGKNCREYCKLRGISKSNIIPKDYTNEQIRLYNANKKKVAKIIRVLTNEITKQISLFQLNIKTNQPSLASNLSKEEFTRNLENYNRLIQDNTSKLESSNYVIKNAISSLKNNLATNVSDNWLKTCVKNYIYNNSDIITQASINEIKNILGGAEN